MTEALGLGELAARGLRRMEELHLAQADYDVFRFQNGQLLACCILGVILLGLGITPDERTDTSEAIELIAEHCPAIKRQADLLVPVGSDDENNIGNVLWRLNDGGWYFDLKPKSVPEIIIWLETNNL